MGKYGSTKSTLSKIHCNDYWESDNTLNKLAVWIIKIGCIIK